MRKGISILVLLLFIAAFASAKEPAQSLSVDALQILKISPQDERAVIKTPDGKMQIIKVGDPIGDHGKVSGISRDRMVVEEKKDRNIERIVIRLENGKQRVERISRVGEKRPLLYAPAATDATK